MNESITKMNDKRMTLQEIANVTGAAYSTVASYAQRAGWTQNGVQTLLNEKQATIIIEAMKATETGAAFHKRENNDTFHNVIEGIETDQSRAVRINGGKMNELIKVNYETENPTVSGRDLHEFLGVGTLYKDWFPRMCEYGFSEGIDFNLLIFEQVQKEGERDVTRKVADHALSFDMAKELCMLARSEKGKQARQYFIAIEKSWNSPELVMARAIKLADMRIKQQDGQIRLLESENTQQKQIIGELKPKADYVDYILSSSGTMAITQIAADYGLSANKLNKILRDEGIQRKVNGQWILLCEYMNMGYTDSDTISITHSDGRPGTVLFTKWTQKGRLKINDLLNRRGIYANADIGRAA